jgi:hypothetical protein
MLMKRWPKFLVVVLSPISICLWAFYIFLPVVFGILWPANLNYPTETNLIFFSWIAISAALIGLLSLVMTLSVWPTLSRPIRLLGVLGFSPVLVFAISCLLNMLWLILRQDW